MTAPARITEPGVYDIEPGAYHNDPCPEPSFSAGIGNLLLSKSPAHAFRMHPRLGGETRAPSSAMAIGSVCHEMLLGKGGGFHIIAADSYRTKEAKAERDRAETKKLTPILEAQHRAAVMMLEQVEPELHEMAPDFSPGKSEVAMFWQDDGLWCRALCDRLTMSRVIYDLKFTGINIGDDEALCRHIYGGGFDLIAAHYMDGAAALGCATAYRFVFIETEAPHGIRIVELDGIGQELGATKLAHARQRFRDCLATAVWPSYPRDVFRAEPKPWQTGPWIGAMAGVS